jgi:hypothetical protein
VRARVQSYSRMRVAEIGKRDWNQLQLTRKLTSATCFVRREFYRQLSELPGRRQRSRRRQQRTLTDTHSPEVRVERHGGVPLAVLRTRGPDTEYPVLWSGLPLCMSRAHALPTQPVPVDLSRRPKPFTTGEDDVRCSFGQHCNARPVALAARYRASTPRSRQAARHYRGRRWPARRASAQVRRPANDRRHHRRRPDDPPLHLRRRLHDGARGGHDIQPHGHRVHRARSASHGSRARWRQRRLFPEPAALRLCGGFVVVTLGRGTGAHPRQRLPPRHARRTAHRFHGRACHLRRHHE